MAIVWRAMRSSVTLACFRVSQQYTYSTRLFSTAMSNFIDENRIFADTAGKSSTIHFNNAGCSLPPTSVLNKQIDYLKSEATIGGYETAGICNILYVLD